MDVSGNCRIVVTEPISAEALDRLRTAGEVCQLSDTSPQALIEALPDADALLVRSKTHVTARIIEAGPKLRVIGRAGASVDHIDLRVAQRRGINVVYTPHLSIRAMSDLTLAMILCVHRRIPYFDRRLRDSTFEAVRQALDATGSRPGVLGLLGLSPVSDTVGRVLVEILGWRCIYHDPAGGRIERFEAAPVSLDELLARADVLSVHLSLSPQNRGILSAERLAQLRPSAKLVNTGRGGLLDERALAEMLKCKQLAGAAVQIYENEPLSAEHPLRTTPNCLLVPHIGSFLNDPSEAVSEVIEDVLRVLRGESPLHAAAKSTS